MKVNSLSTFALFACVLFCLHIAEAALEPERPGSPERYFNTAIRVLIERQASRIELSSILHTIHVRPIHSLGWQAIGRRAIVTLSFRKDKAPYLVVNGTPFLSNELVFRNHIEGDLFRYKGSLFRGRFTLTIQNNALVVVNTLPLEEYLMGTLAAEMSSHWETEALKAQAVASRTYALYMKTNPRGKLYDLERTVSDQVYSGVHVESKRVVDVVKATSGQYLVSTHLPIKAFFHSRCGGTTETAEEVWKTRRLGHHQPVPCPYCRSRPHPWTLSLARGELSRLLSFNNSPQLSMVPLKSSLSGRISLLKVVTPEKERILTSNELRNLIGFSRLKSAYFEWKMDENRISFEGKGVGHGVGMCQWGAQHLAKEGNSYNAILRHYYPNTRLTK